MSDNEDENSSRKQAKPINIGSIISISHFQDNNAFIMSDGHINKEVMLKNFGNSKPQKSNEKNNLLGKENFSSTLFLIYPKSSNGKKSEILKLLYMKFKFWKNFIFS